MKNKRTSREVIIIHDDYHERLASLLLSYLSKYQGNILSKRNQRWGCNPDFYKKVILLDTASLESSSTSNVIKVYVTPYDEVKATQMLAEYTLTNHWESQASKICEGLEKALS